MTCLIAPDKFKGSLSGLAFCSVVEKTLHRMDPTIQCIWAPLADGGDGTVEVMKFYLNGRIVNCTVTGPLFKPVNATYLISEDGQTAFIEMAESSGVRLIDHPFSCMDTTSYGTGELIQHACKSGVKEIVLGIGGSATNDGGIGMAAGLGYQFLDGNGRPLLPSGRSLPQIRHIVKPASVDALQGVTVVVACDVTNPLYGKDGAARIYGPQKGASPEQVEYLDQGLKHLSKMVSNDLEFPFENSPGYGAAGGLGFGAKVFLGAELSPGIDLIKRLADFDNTLRKVDWVITGEGQLDQQTLSGKTIQGILDSVQLHRQKVVVFCGSNALKDEALKGSGIDYVDAVMHYAEDLEDAMSHAGQYLEQMVEQWYHRSFSP